MFGIRGYPKWGCIKGETLKLSFSICVETRFLNQPRLIVHNIVEIILCEFSLLVSGGGVQKQVSDSTMKTNDCIIHQ